MTTSAEPNLVPLDCNGSLVEFGFNFPIGATEDLNVYLIDSSGAGTLLTETTHYSVAPGTYLEDGRTPDWTDGGTVTMKTAYADGNSILIIRNTPLEQESDFIEGMPTLFDSFEAGLDKLTRIVQDMEEDSGRSPKFGVTSAFKDLILPELQGSMYFKTNVGGNGIVLVSSNPSITDYEPPWYDVRDYPLGINSAVAAIGSAKALLLVPDTQPLTDDLTSPSTLRIKVLDGGSIVASGFTFTCNGPFEGCQGCLVDFAAGEVTFGS